MKKLLQLRFEKNLKQILIFKIITKKYYENIF